MGYIWLLLTPITVLWGIISSFVLGQIIPMLQQVKLIPDKLETNKEPHQEDHKNEVPESKLMGTLQDCLPTMMMMKITLGTEIPHSKCEYMIIYILKKKIIRSKFNSIPNFIIR